MRCMAPGMSRSRRSAGQRPGADGQSAVRIGIEAAIQAAHQILLGEADVVLTGGVESMSQAPHVIRGLRSGLRLGQGQLEDTLWSALLDTHCGCTMAATAENCAAKYGVSREAQDEYAMRSQQLAARAWAEGRFDDEVVPVELKTRREPRSSPAMTTCDPRRRWTCWRSCRQRSATTAALPPATHPASSTAAARR